MYPTRIAPSLKTRLEQIPFGDRDSFIARPFGVKSSGTISTMIPARTGQVALIRKVIQNTQGANVTTPTPISDNMDIRLIDAGGTTRSTLSLFCPNKNLGAGGLQAVNDRPFTWEPRHPIVIPSGWRCDVLSDSTNSLNTMFVVDRLDENSARHLGFNCDTGATQTDRMWIAVGDKFAAANPTIVAGRAGLCIEITDIVVRIQPTVANATVTLQDTDNVPIFRWIAGGLTGEPVEQVIKPRIFLSVGKGLELDISTNAINRGSFILVGRFVAERDVPRNAFWSHQNPVRPTFSIAATAQGAAFTLNYPDGTTRVVPVKGMQHILEGWSISAAKDATDVGAPIPTSIVLATVVFDSGGGPALAIGQVNFAVMPVFSLSTHNQHFNFVVDEIALRGPTSSDASPNAGSILFETSTALKVGEDGDIQDWSATVWGETRVSRLPGGQAPDQLIGT